MNRYILGVTGASGAIYATRTAMHLKRLGHDVSLIVTAPGREVVEYEGQKALFDYTDTVFNVDDFFAECASGSADYACLKERRSLVIVPREMPYNLIHLENMERVTRAGAVVIPASPQFYSKPASIEDLVDTVVAKVLKHLGAVSAADCAGIVKPWGTP